MTDERDRRERDERDQNERETADRFWEKERQIERDWHTTHDTDRRAQERQDNASHYNSEQS